MRRIGWGVVLWLLMLGGCSQGPGAEDGYPLRLGTNVWPGYEPLYLARSLELLDPGRLRLVEYPSTSEVLRAFRNRSIEAASVTLDEALLLRSQGLAVTVVLVHDISDGADVVMARPGIESMTMLKGKRIGVEAGALGALMVTRALELSGLSIDDVTIVNEDANMHEEAYRRGEVDAVVTFEPMRTRLLKLGARQVFSSKAIPGEVVDVLVVRSDVLAQKPEAIRQLIAGWFTALDYMLKDMAGAAQLMADRLQITPDEVSDSYSGLILPDVARNRELLGGSQPQLLKTAERMGRIMADYDLLDGPLDTAGFVSSAYLPQGQ